MTTRRPLWRPARYWFALTIAAAAALGAPSAALAQSTPTDRQMVQHVLRRFAFSAPPETVTAVLAGGQGWLSAANAWLMQQINTTNDVNAFPMDAPTSSAPLNARNTNNSDLGYERGYVEHSIGTNLQLRAKLELHWLDHFSIVASEASDWTEMMIYDQLVRQNALGNFQTLLTAVSETPAELMVLNNTGNIGSNPKTPPNVNFARELMQVFSIGPFKLNMDGSQQLDAYNNPISNYSEADVTTLAYWMTGYAAVTNSQTTDPLAAVTTSYNVRAHYQGIPGSFNGNPLNVFMGQSFRVPSGQDPIAYVVGLLAKNASTAPFQAKELLLRFVTETPTAGDIARMANVWRANVNSPNQIAQVVQAIVNDPEFVSSYQSMPKQPVETLFQFARQLPGTFAPLTATAGYGGTTTQGAAAIINALSAMGQNPYQPPTVFSFYPPGQVETASTNSEYLTWTTRSGWFAANTASSNAGFWIDVPTLRQRIATANGNVSPDAITGVMVANYILDAMIDGGASNRLSTLIQMLGKKPGDWQIQSAIRVVAASPEYIVN